MLLSKTFLQFPTKLCRKGCGFVDAGTQSERKAANFSAAPHCSSASGRWDDMLSTGKRLHAGSDGFQIVRNAVVQVQ